MKTQQPLKGEWSDSFMSQVSSAFNDVQSLFKEVKTTSVSIGKNVPRLRQYGRKMQENSSYWAVHFGEQYTLDQDYLRRLQLYAKYYNVLYGDPSNPSFLDKALNYAILNFKDKYSLYEYIIQKYVYFGVTHFTHSNIKQDALYQPVFVMFELDGIVYIIIRGTYSIKDIMADGFGVPEEIRGERIHGGFGRSVYFVLDIIGNSFVGRDVVVIGHSYGAAIGAILAHFMYENAKSVKAYCYGCPPCYSSAMIRSQRDITTIVYGQDPVPRMGMYGLAAFNFRLDSMQVNTFYTNQDIFDTLVKGGLDPAEIMFVPGNILHMNPTVDVSGKIENIECFYVDCREYLEFIPIEFGKKMKDHYQYLKALSQLLNDPCEAPVSADSEIKSDDDMSFFRRIFKK